MDPVKQVLVLNTGSSTLKWTLLRANDEFSAASGGVSWGVAAEGPRVAHIQALLRAVPDFAAVGHRMVQGGTRYRETVAVDAGVRADLETLVARDPLHLVPALECIDAVRARFPSVPQYAAFDTAFHANLPAAAAAYALPHEWTERWDLRRYGFHGLSVAYSARRARELT